jgi:glycerophosphoryl diester phosphodiesterase
MKYIAHRGKTMTALENTKEAFIDAALDSHFDGIECDIYTSNDGEFIIFHDESTKRLSSKKHQIMDLSYDEIKQIKLYDKNKNTYEIPHLVEFLDICKTHQKQPIIELKKIHDITLLHNLIAIIDDYADLDPVIISFNINYLKYLRAISSLNLYFLTIDINDELIYDCRVNSLNIYMNKESMTKPIISKLKKKGFMIGIFTVNDKKTEAICKELLIDLLTTDKL